MDLMAVFVRNFAPTDDGYLYYSGPRLGGKRVTVEEHAELVSNWRRVVGPAGWLKIGGLTLAAILLVVFVSIGLGLPRWVVSVVPWVLMVSIWSWIMWAAAAPARLTRDRPEVAPPRGPIQG